MNEEKIQKLFATLETEELVEQLQECKGNEEATELVKQQLGQEFIKLLAVSESLDIDFEDAINLAVGELELEHGECESDDCDSDDCCDDEDCNS
jgi:NTP pyrophosphatase (non-canonical NTP hydrolase)